MQLCDLVAPLIKNKKNNIEDVRSNSNETHKVTSSLYISYNLLLEGSEHELI